MGDADDMCPICRSSRYLNPDMKFLVNPECYHKMCESCVDRIFSVGPAPCPYVGCGKTLRKGRFKTQVFDDLKVEREVDVRQRVVKIFNRREDAFDTEAEYNDYLEEIESLIFAIAQGSEAERDEAEQRVSEYDKLHKQEIIQNALQQKQDDVYAEEQAASDAEHQRRLRLLAIELQQQEAELAAQQEKETIEALEAGKSGEEAVRESRERAQLRAEQLRQQFELELSRPRRAIVRKGTAAAHAKAARTPFTPFVGDRQTEYLFDQADEYLDPTMERANDPAVRAGGFTAALAQQEALKLAFMSLDIDIQAEKAAAIAV